MLIWSFFFSYTEFIAKFMSFYKISVTNNKSIQHDDDHEGASLISLSHTHSEIWSFLAENHMWQYCLYRLRFLYITQTDWTIFLNKYMHNYVIKIMSWERYCALICSAYIYIIAAGCIMNKKRLIRFCYFPDEVASVYIAQNKYSTLTYIFQKVMD